MASQTWLEVKVEPQDDESLYGGAITSTNAAEAAARKASAEGVAGPHPAGKAKRSECNAVNYAEADITDGDHLIEKVDAESRHFPSAASEADVETASASRRVDFTTARNVRALTPVAVWRTVSLRVAQ